MARFVAPPPQAPAGSQVAGQLLQGFQTGFNISQARSARATQERVATQKLESARARLAESRASRGLQQQRIGFEKQRLGLEERRVKVLEARPPGRGLTPQQMGEAARQKVLTTGALQKVKGNKGFTIEVDPTTQQRRLVPIGGAATDAEVRAIANQLSSDISRIPLKAPTPSFTDVPQRAKRIAVSAVKTAGRRAARAQARPEAAGAAPTQVTGEGFLARFRGANRAEKLRIFDEMVANPNLTAEEKQSIGARMRSAFRGE